MTYSDSKTKDWRWIKFCEENAQRFGICAKKNIYSVIVDPYDRILGTGFNGAPKGFKECVDGGCPRALNMESGSNYNNCIAIHAEANAIINSDYSARRIGCSLYVNASPCMDCSKLIANSFVTRLIFKNDQERWEGFYEFMIVAGIEIVVY